MGVTFAARQSVGTVPVCIDLVKINASGTAMEVTLSLRNLDEIPSGPEDELTLRLPIFLATAAGVNCILLMVWLPCWGGHCGMLLRSSLENTAVKALFSRVAISLLSVIKLFPTLRGPTLSLDLVLLLI